MRITKETLRQAFEEGKSSRLTFDTWYNLLTKKDKKVEVLGVEWVDFKEEVPKDDNFYVTKVKWKGKVEEVADWWNGHCFMYNNDLITHWKRK